jgi:thioredoxin-like negative regulator of GroEL
VQAELAAGRRAARRRLGVRGIPSFIVFERGANVFQHAGGVDAQQMLNWLERAAA